MKRVARYTCWSMWLGIPVVNVAVPTLDAANAASSAPCFRRYSIKDRKSATVLTKRLRYVSARSEHLPNCPSSIGAPLVFGGRPDKIFRAREKNVASPR